MPLRAGSCWIVAGNRPQASSSGPRQRSRLRRIRSVSSGERRRYSRQGGNCCPGPEGCYCEGCCHEGCCHEDESCVVLAARSQDSIGTGLSVPLRKGYWIGAGY